jgi:hypothetical protein
VSLESELRQTSDELLANLARLSDLESAKRDSTPGTSEFVELSRQVEVLAAQVLATSRRQSDLAITTRVVSEAGLADAPRTPIAEVPPAREPHVILAEWRDAERKLAEAIEGSAQARELEESVDRLRDEYGRSFDARR